MTDHTKIEWADSTFNPWEGCQKVGPGCDNCYAENRNARFGGGVAVNWGPGAPRRRTSKANWSKPIAWERDAMLFKAAMGRRRRVFCASLADVFDNQAPPQWRGELWSLIRATPSLDWLLLTKRIGNVSGMLPADWFDGWPNVWLGATVVNQEEADRDIPKLLDVPARVRFLSIEPMLGPIDLFWPETLWPNGPARCCSSHECGCMGQPIDPWLMYGIHWVIAGGESGPHARPMHPDWARSLRDQCAAAGVPYLFKQWGEWLDSDVADAAGLPWSATRATAGAGWRRVGKKAAGRLLDGVEHNGFPVSA